MRLVVSLTNEEAVFYMALLYLISSVVVEFNLTIQGMDGAKLDSCVKSEILHITPAAYIHRSDHLDMKVPCS